MLTQAGTVRVVTAKLGIDPQYPDTIHDDYKAKQFGFQSALVGGAAVGSFMMHMFVAAWGEKFLRSGMVVERQRKPVYEKDRLTVIASPEGVGSDGRTIDVVLKNEQDEEVATSTGTLPDRPLPAPSLNEFPFRKHLAEPTFIAGGQHKAGDIFRSTSFAYDQPLHDEYVERTREDLPIFARDNVMLPGYHIKACMHDGGDTYRRETPSVHLGYTLIQFDVGHVGDTISTSGHITKVWERNGNFYLEAEQLVVANFNRPLALVRRNSIYTLGKKTG